MTLAPSASRPRSLRHGAALAACTCVAFASGAHALDARQSNLVNWAKANMSQGQIIGNLTLSVGADIECDGLGADKQLHDALLALEMPGESKAKRDREAANVLKAFNKRHALKKEKDSTVFCAGIVREMEKGTFLGNLMKRGKGVY